MLTLGQPPGVFNIQPTQGIFSAIYISASQARDWRIMGYTCLILLVLLGWVQHHSKMTKLQN